MANNYYSVSTAAELNADIAAIDAAGVANTAYQITITTDLTLGADLTPIALASGDTLTITGNSLSSGEGNPTATLDGNNFARGFVVQSGAVTLDSLNVINMVAKGGKGGSGLLAGGGGAGLGGGLFVGAGASVSLTNDQFSGNAAHGGAGGTVTSSGTGAGGTGEPGGFGAGGSGGQGGGFGGGGGTGASGGFGAGNNAGGGLAAGGEIFVQQGGQLSVSNTTIDGGGLSGGAAGTHGTAGSAFGGGIFEQGGGAITLASGAITGVIADQTGSGGTGPNAGALTVDITGPVTLSAADTYTGGTLIEGGALTLANAKAAGSAAISFSGGGSLIVAPGATPANTIVGFTDSSKASIDLQGLGAPVSASLGAGNQLTVTGTGGGAKLNLDPNQAYANDTFYLTSDGAGGTDVSVLQTTYAVASEADLNAAIQAIDLTGANSRPNTAYQIDFTGGFSLQSDLYAINLAAGDTLTINGGGQTMDGGGVQRGFFVYAGSVAIDNLTIAHTSAAGGAGGAGASAGGGGAGLGGGLFIGSAGQVTLTGVSFLNDTAIGGAGGGSGAYVGGGGGLGGNGGYGAYLHFGGGGGVGLGANGGTTGSHNGGAGILLGEAGGNPGVYSAAGAGGADGGGGGVGGYYPGSGKDPHPGPAPSGGGGVSNASDWGGGGGTAELAGFGGGGSGGGAAGWGGGSGGGAAGFGGGTGDGGGGLGAGGAIFVEQGGQLTIAGGQISGGSALGGAAGAGGTAGSGYGGGVFLQGGETLTLAPGAGQALTIGDVIADEAGSGGQGSGALMLAGAGTLTLSAANTFTGGVTLESGTLSLQAQGAAGAGVITFYYGDAANLTIGAGDVPTNLIDGFLPGDTIDLQGIGVATSATLGAGDVLKIKGGSTAISLNLDPSQTFTGESFKVQSDGAGGTLVTAVTTGGDYPPHIFGGGVTIDGADDAALSPLSAVTVADANANRIDTATLTLSSTANGALSNFGTGSYNANTGVYTVSGTAAAITTALDGLVFTPIDHQVAPGSAVDTSFQLTVGDGTMSDSATNVAHVVAQNTPPAWQNVPPPFIKSLFTVPMTPFAGVSLTDPDVGAMETVTITIGGGGTLSLANPVDGVSLTETSTNVYTLTTATPAAESAALQAVTFTGAFNASGFQLIGVGLSASDGTAVTTASTEIMCGAPIISGSQAQATDDATPIAPFGGVTIQDSPEYTSDQVTITVQNGAGVDTDANGLLSGAGLTHVGVGMYTLVAGSPAFLTQEIEALTFTPAEHQAAAGSQVTTNFVISVFNGATTSDDNGGSVTTTETAGPTYRLTTGADTVTGASGNDKIIAKTNTLSAGDQVQGGPGVNTLWLTGAGKFDLRLPATLSGVSRVEAQEGQPAKAGGAYQTVYLRSGLDAVIDVAPALINGANPNAPTITIVGAAGDSSTINLSSGNDIVTVGAAAETIHGGSGIDTIKVTAATIAASIDGGLSGQSVLDVTGGGTVAMGASVTNIAVVNLMASSSPYAFTANGIADLVVDDLSKGADQVTAGAAGQTITGGGAGKLTMIGAAGGGTTFKDASAILSGDSIQNFGAGADVLTLTDMAAASVTGTFTENAQGTAGVLSLTDGTHSAQVTFFGQLAAAGFSGSFANAGFSTAADPVSGTDVTWAHAMAAAAQH